MGKTAFNGPVYGAKSLLWSFGPLTGTSNASSAIFSVGANRTLPLYEDWYLTEMWVTCSTCTSNAARVAVKTEGGSTTIPARLEAPGNGSTRAQTVFNINSGTSTSISTSAIATTDGGQFEGAWVPAGSTMRIVSSGNSAIGQLFVQIMGFIRYIESTRGS